MTRVQKCGSVGALLCLSFLGCVSATAPLHYAAYKSDVAQGRKLIRMGYDVNARQDSYTPLHIAIMDGLGGSKGNPKFVAMLLSEGADPNLKDRYGMTPLHCAKLGLDKVAVLLLDHGADPNIADNRGNTSLHYYVRSYDSLKADLLLSKGAGINVKNLKGQTPLHHVAEFGSFGSADTVGLLLKAGADIDARDNDGSTPMHYAANRWGPDVLDALIEGGANLDLKDKQGRLPIHIANMKHGGDIDGLVTSGSNMNVKNKSGYTPLHRAAKAGAAPVVRILIAMGADVNAKTNDGLTPLSLADIKFPRGRSVKEVLRKHGGK